MTNKLHRWEISLIIGFLAALLFGAAGAGAQAGLDGKLVRLHVVAASDSQEDQLQKLRVRDEVLRYMETPLRDARDAGAAMEIIAGHVPGLEERLEEFLAAEGSARSVTVELCEQYGFPTRHYEGFALPAGRYKALRVVLGEGGGQNWWCVVFPPLCAAAAMEDLPDVSREAGLTDEDIGLITQEDEGYVIKFKILEWFGALRNWLGQ